MILTMPSYQEICRILHVPNLSMFSAGHQFEPNESLSYSTAEERWSAFMQKKPQLRGDIDANPPPNWEQLKEVVKFSWIANRYCDFVESQPHHPPESHAQATLDDGSSSHTPSAGRAPLAQDEETFTYSTDEDGTGFSSTSNNPPTGVPSPALDESVCQFDGLPAHLVIQCDSSDALEPQGKRRRLDCSNWAETGVNLARAASQDPLLPDTTTADTAFSAIGSTKARVAVVGTPDGNWISSDTPTMSDPVQGAGLSWLTDEHETDFGFLTELWGDGLDVAPRHGGPMEDGQLD